MFFDELSTPIGRITVAADETGLRHVMFPVNRHGPRDHTGWTRDAENRCLRDVRIQLTEYFAGTRRQFDLELAPRGTAFQLQVWAALATIPFGETWSYAQLAERIGSPRAMRAVGSANGRNPLPIVIPCHRVIGANGTLTGFGGGLETKASLLQLERPPLP